MIKSKNKPVTAGSKSNKTKPGGSSADPTSGGKGKGPAKKTPAPQSKSASA